MAPAALDLLDPEAASVPEWAYQPLIPCRERNLARYIELAWKGEDCAVLDHLINAAQALLDEDNLSSSRRQELKDLLYVIRRVYTKLTLEITYLTNGDPKNHGKQSSASCQYQSIFSKSPKEYRESLERRLLNRRWVLLIRLEKEEIWSSERPNPAP
ncbi:MAG TPA: hypothetical protein VEB60_03140 [Candidatus Paceibacterota bacterium]|nr:hypothetical protein [Candidatus Paceibacterota bacterium]